MHVLRSAIKNKKNVVTTSYVSPAMMELDAACVPLPTPLPTTRTAWRGSNGASESSLFAAVEGMATAPRRLASWC